MFDSSTVMLYPLNFVIQVSRFQKFTWKESQQFMLLRHFDGLKGINSSIRDWVGVDVWFYVARRDINRLI